MTRLILAAALAVPLFAGSAFAVDNTMTTPATTAPSANSTAGQAGDGIRMADHATMAIKYATTSSAAPCEKVT